MARYRRLYEGIEHIYEVGDFFTFVYNNAEFKRFLFSASKRNPGVMVASPVDPKYKPVYVWQMPNNRFESTLEEVLDCEIVYIQCKGHTIDEVLDQLGLSEAVPEPHEPRLVVFMNFAYLGDENMAAVKDIITGNSPYEADPDNRYIMFSTFKEAPMWTVKDKVMYGEYRLCEVDIHSSSTEMEDIDED